MLIDLGNFSLCAAILLAGAALVAGMAAARFAGPRRPGLFHLTRGLLAGAFTLFTAASGLLLAALAQSDFRLDYVVRYTERALPLGYKLAAFWAGQEGSLLLWGWMIAAMVGVELVARRREATPQYAVALSVLAGVLGFFGALMLFAANPFAVAATTPDDGQGLNPMLQNWGMIAHPPLLFLGYAGFTVPFALMIGALITGQVNSGWIHQIRRWTLAAWVFLTVGIILGAQWAYVELGWGGYWAWDPVENASLLPWLTATALLHSLMVQQSRGMLKVWNVVLTALTFILCFFGTYLTRSGVIESVHAFPKSLVGTFFLVFLAILGVLSLALILARLRELKSEQRLEELLSREGAFLIANVLLVVIMLTTLVGTIFPLLSGLTTGRAVSVGQPFYNKVVVPMGLVLVALMAAGPLLTYGRGAAAKMWRGLRVPGAIALVTAAALWLAGVHSLWAAACVAIGTAAILNIAVDLTRQVAERVGRSRENRFVAVIRQLDGNHRRYGGQLVHLGVVLLVAGIAGSSLFGIKETLQLTPGQSTSFQGYSVKLEAVGETTGPNYTAVDAAVTIIDRSGDASVLHPQRRFYNKSREASSEVAILTTWRQDLYVILAGREDSIVALQVLINPLVVWIWVGGLVMTLGGIVGLLPRLLPLRAAAPEPQLHPAVPVCDEPRVRPAVQAAR